MNEPAIPPASATNYILELCGELVGENPRAMQRKENVLTTTQAGHNDTLIVMAVCQ